MCTVSFLLAFPLHLTKPRRYYLPGIVSIPSQCVAPTAACPTPSPSSPNCKLREAPAPSSRWVNLPPNGGLTLLLIFGGIWRQETVHPEGSVPFSLTGGETLAEFTGFVVVSSLCELLRQAPGLLCFLKCQPSKSALNDGGGQSGCVTVHRCAWCCASCQALPCCILPFKASTMSTRVYLQGAGRSTSEYGGGSKDIRKKSKLECQPSLLCFICRVELASCIRQVL